MIEKEKIKILLVDDEEDNLALLYRTLRGEKFQLTKTTSPIEALEFMEGKKYDIIISDHKMPEMDGVEFLKKCFEKDPSNIRLLVTAYSDASILIDAINYAKIYRYIKKPWSPDELVMIVNAAVDYLTLKQDNERLINDLKELFSGTINAIVEALDAKDAFTFGRSRRVTFYALKMGTYLNLPSEEIGKIELAGLLHDIGMIGVPEEILNKTDKLTSEEYELIKKHVDQGVKILEDIKQLNEVVEIIKYHHERYDGDGYPNKLKGDDIPLNARIIAIADTYDSMISDRSYRNKMDHDEAVLRIKAQAGRQFDPKIVDAFVAVIPDAIADIKAFKEKQEV